MVHVPIADSWARRSEILYAVLPASRHRRTVSTVQGRARSSPKPDRHVPHRHISRLHHTYDDDRSKTPDHDWKRPLLQTRDHSPERHGQLQTASLRSASAICNHEHTIARARLPGGRPMLPDQPKIRSRRSRLSRCLYCSQAPPLPVARRGTLCWPATGVCQ